MVEGGRSKGVQGAHASTCVLKSRLMSRETSVTMVILKFSSAAEVSQQDEGHSDFMSKSFWFLNIDGVTIFTVYTGTTLSHSQNLPAVQVFSSVTALKSATVLIDGYGRISFGILCVPCNLLELLF